MFAPLLIKDCNNSQKNENEETLETEMVYYKVAESWWQIMFNTILVYCSAEKHIFFEVSWNSSIKAFDTVNDTFNH